MKRVTAADVLRLQPSLVALNPPATRVTPANALVAHAHPDDRPVVAKAQARRASAHRGAVHAQHNGVEGEAWIEEQLAASAVIAWWRHFYPPFLRVQGVWRPRAIEADEGAVDYTIQPRTGPSILLEAKSTDSGRFAVTDLPEHQVRHLEDHHAAGLPAFLAVRFRPEGLHAVFDWGAVPWVTRRSAEALYPDEPAVRARVINPTSLVDVLLRVG